MHRDREEVLEVASGDNVRRLVQNFCHQHKMRSKEMIPALEDYVVTKIREQSKPA